MRFAKSMLSCLVATSMLMMPLQVRAQDEGLAVSKVKHVLLISVDGLHALDLTNYVATHGDSTLASLWRHGFTYTNNSTSQPSDSFPGLASLVTGGSPTTTGFWYDVTYNRAVSPPAETTLTVPITGGPNLCPSVIGTPVAFDESDDFDLTFLDGDGGINPKNLPRDPNNGCKPIYPHEYLRVNTIFEVVKANGGHTAWVDKHPSYEWTNGPSGKGVDDFYGPEINSNTQMTDTGKPIVIPFPGCNPVPFVDNNFDDGWTTDFRNIQCYDMLHVQAVINEIDGWNHNHTKKVGVPTLFGFNYQAVSVGEKLNNGPITGGGPNVSGGYIDTFGTPALGLAFELDFVDHTLGRIVDELKNQGLFDSTVIIICAKHGQSPIERSKNVNIPGSIPGALGGPGTVLGPLEAFDISDDGSLIWLADQEELTAAVTALTQNEALPTVANPIGLGIQEIFAGNALRNKWNDPGNDPRTPDIILKVDTGVIFAGSNKIAEHGGINEDDIHTALLVSFPSLSQTTVKTPTSNQQVAASIVKALGIDPNQLEAVKKEQIQVLPFLFGDSD
jgi:hypothetical protein